MIEDILLRPAYMAAAVGVAFLAFLLYQIFKPLNLPKDIPVFGIKEGEWFAYYRAAWRNNLNFKAVMQETYANYSTKGKPVQVPVLTGNFIVLPPSDTQWLASASESQVSLHKVIGDTFQMDYTISDTDIFHRPIQEALISRTLTSQVGNFVPEVMEEIELQFREVWGTDTRDWTEIGVYDSVHRVISRVTNRVFVGLPISREPALANSGRRYAQTIPVTSYLIRCTPHWLKPLVAALVTIPSRWYEYKWCRVLEPYVARRVAEYEARQRDPEAHKTKPNDFLEWSIQQAKEIGEPALWSPRKLSTRILLVNFAAIHTTSITFTAALLDIICSNRPEYIDEIRREIADVLAEHGGEWNKRSLAKMEKLDSALRESSRLNSFVTMGLGRRVTAREGLDSPSGVHLPYDALAVVPNYSMMHDKAVYGEDAEEYRPFRFAEQRADGSVAYVERARKAFASTGTEYLAFGHGRNACPGRFFAVNEIKLMFGHVLMNYDFKMETERPTDTFIGVVRVGALRKKAFIRRREKA